MAEHDIHITSDDVQQPTVTLIVCAVTSEIAPLVRRLRLVRARGRHGAIVYEGDRGASGRIIVAVTGMGTERAVAATTSLCAITPPKRVIIAGFAGATDPALSVGDVLEPTDLMRQSTGAIYHPTAPSQSPAGRLVTCETLVGEIADKTRLRAETGADAVDMESAAIAGWFDEHGVPWTCIRAVSDAADEALPAFALALTRPDGRPDLAAAARYAITHPRSIGPLMRLGRHARVAGHALAEALTRAIDGG
ncbi:MAG: hypothetical protein WD294_12415 [Phycisphaeraceae bacterium]